MLALGLQLWLLAGMGYQGYGCGYFVCGWLGTLDDFSMESPTKWNFLRKYDENS